MVVSLGEVAEVVVEETVTRAAFLDLLAQLELPENPVGQVSLEHPVCQGIQDAHHSSHVNL